MTRSIPLRAPFTVRPTPAYQRQLVCNALLRLAAGWLGLALLWYLV